MDVRERGRKGTRQVRRGDVGDKRSPQKSTECSERGINRGAREEFEEGARVCRPPSRKQGIRTRSCPRARAPSPSQQDARTRAPAASDVNPVLRAHFKKPCVTTRKSRGRTSIGDEICVPQAWIRSRERGVGQGHALARRGHDVEILGRQVVHRQHRVRICARQTRPRQDRGCQDQVPGSWRPTRFFTRAVYTRSRNRDSGRG